MKEYEILYCWILRNVLLKKDMGYEELLQKTISDIIIHHGKDKGYITASFDEGYHFLLDEKLIKCIGNKNNITDFGYRVFSNNFEITKETIATERNRRYKSKIMVKSECDSKLHVPLWNSYIFKESLGIEEDKGCMSVYFCNYGQSSVDRMMAEIGATLKNSFGEIYGLDYIDASNLLNRISVHAKYTIPMKTINWMLIIFRVVGNKQEQRKEIKDALDWIVRGEKDKKECL